MRTTAELLDAIDGLVYADAFGCALSFEELWRYSRLRIPAAEFRKLLDSPPLTGLIGQQDGYFFLAERGDLATLRPPRQQRARRLENRARRIAPVLIGLPFVRGVLLTGSVAAGDAVADADVDLLILVAPGRLCTVFLLLAPLSKLLSRRIFCPNYYLSQQHLTLRRRDAYTAHELVQCRWLAGEDSFVAANGWATEWYPNAASAAPKSQIASRSLWRHLLEWPLSGSLGNFFEARACKIARKRLHRHYRQRRRPLPDDALELLGRGVELRFHGSSVHSDALRRHRETRAEVETRLGVLRQSCDHTTRCGIPPTEKPLTVAFDPT